jgi:hypothetical protein
MLGTKLRILAFILSLFALVFAFAFFTQQSWALNLWPWDGAYDGLSRLSSIFLASISAAISLSLIWVSRTGRAPSLVAGALNMLIVYLGSGLFMLQSYLLNDSSKLLVASVIILAAVVAMIAILVRFWNRVEHDPQPTPKLVRFAFALIVINLVIAGGALVMIRPNIMPWSLTPQMSVTYGWIFLGAAAYFAYGFLRPSWNNAGGQLLGFLAYDLVLIVPFIQHLNVVPQALVINLIYYIAVLIISSVLAIYFLFVHKNTRVY